jgi:hypothetical protein
MRRNKVKMPSSVRLAGRTFPIEVSAKVGKSVLGRYRPVEGKIMVAPGMSDDQTKAVVLHEMFHDFSNNSTNDLTEVQVNSMAALTFAALRDNPDLVAWMMS